MPALAVEAAAEDVRRDLVGGLSMVNARTGGGKVIRKEIEKMKKSLEEVEKRLDHLTKVKTADEIFSGPVSEAP